VKKLATMLVAAVLCTGCVGSLLESGNEAPEVYRLAGASLQDRGEPLPLALAVAPPRASASLDTDRIAVVQPDSRFDYFSGVRWAEPAPQMLQQLLVRALAADGRFATVVAAPSRVPADLALDVELRSFEAVYAGGAGVPVVGVVDIVPPPQAEAMAKDLVARGYRVIKVKIGLDAQQDLQRVKSVRKAVGDGIRIRVDGNQGYDRATAMWVFARMEEVGLEWIEQPLPHWDLEGLQALCQRLDTPVAVDESVHTPEDAMRVIRTDAADVVNIKVTKCGGIDRSQKIAAVCAAAGIPCYVGGCIETHPGVAASVHFYAATPNIVSAAELRAESAYVDDVVVTPLVELDGAIALPKAPGLGVAVDEEKVARYRASF